MDKQKKAEAKKDVEDLPVFEKRVWKVFGVTVFSVSREIDENTLTDRMSEKIWLNMREELSKIGAGRR